MKAALFVSLIVLVKTTLRAQEKLSLADVIAIAQSKSPSQKLIETEKKISYFQFQTYTSSLKPKISLYANLPTYNKQYTPVVQPNGEVNYLPLQQNVNRLGISLNQQLPLTGGTLSLNSELTHFYNFSSKFKQYNGTPVFIHLLQPVFGLNKLKWDKQIEPLKLEGSRREYLQQREQIAHRAAVLFFDVLMAQTNIEIAKSNFIETNENFEIEKKRVNLGTTTEDRLLQLQLRALKSRQDHEEAEYEYRMAKLNLKSFLGFNGNEEFYLVLQDELPALSVNLQDAIEYAKKYRPEYVVFERKRIESARDVKSAKVNNQQIIVDVSYGFNRASDQLKQIYSDSKEQQKFSISVYVPLVDWGRNKASYNTAKAVAQQVAFNNTIEDANIQMEITTLVNNIELLKRKITLAKTADSLSKARYALANKLFQIGKLSVIELNTAQLEKDNSIRSHLSALKDFWIACYLLRRLTLYDFDKKEKVK